MTAAPERSHWLLPFQPDSGGLENLPVCRIAETFRPDWSKQANSQTMKYRSEFPDLSLANCYFAYDSSGFPVLLPFCEVQSSRLSTFIIDRCLTGTGRNCGIRAIVGLNGPKNDADVIELVTVNA